MFRNPLKHGRALGLNVVIVQSFNDGDCFQVQATTGALFTVKKKEFISDAEVEKECFEIDKARERAEELMIDEYYSSEVPGEELEGEL